jgi:hypothetical protein
MCSRNALPKMLEEYASKDPDTMAELSGGRFEEGNINLKYCNIPLKISHPFGEFTMLPSHRDSGEKELAVEEKVVIAQYLMYSCGLPARGTWISFLDLKGGPLHWLPFQKEALIPLAHHYHDRLSLFLERGLEYGGTLIEQGDAGIVIPVLPRLNLAFIIWKGGEGFEPRSMILFDSVAEAYLSTATLYVLGIQATIRVWFPGDTRFSQPFAGKGIFNET